MNREALISHIMSNTHQDIKAFTLLLDKNLENQAITLMYACIDRMAWLYSEVEESGNREFKEWTDSFFFKGETFPFNSDDLWAARCGTVHTGAAESRDYRKDKANLIYYHSVRSGVSDEALLEMISPLLSHMGISRDRVRLIDHFWLADRIVASAYAFHMELKASPDEVIRRISDKASRQLTFQAVR